MKRSCFLLSLLAMTSCGEIEQSVNPSDVSKAGTALAILSSAGLEVADDVNENARTGELEEASTAAPPHGLARWCMSEVTLSGAVSRKIQATTCTPTVGDSGDPGGITFGIDAGASVSLEWKSLLHSVPVPQAVTASFQRDKPVPRMWMAECRLALSSSEAWRTADAKQSRWTADIHCPNPATRHEMALDGQWHPARGQKVRFEDWTVAVGWRH